MSEKQIPNTASLYDNTVKVRHYDVSSDVLPSTKNDIQFYLGVTKTYGGPVLELGCGTGRVLIEIAKSGLCIDGLDNSTLMLNALQAKLDAHDKIRGLVNLYESDMRNFTIPKQYQLVIAPFRPFQHLYTVSDQVATFNKIHSHLKPGGVLAFNVFYLYRPKKS